MPLHRTELGSLLEKAGHTGPKQHWQSKSKSLAPKARGQTSSSCRLGGLDRKIKGEEGRELGRERAEFDIVSSLYLISQLLSTVCESCSHRARTLSL